MSACLISLPASFMSIDNILECFLLSLRMDDVITICYQQVICRARCSYNVVAPSLQSCSSCGSSSRGVFTDEPVSRVLIRMKSRCDSHEQPAPHRQHEAKRDRIDENLGNVDLGADKLFEE